MTSPYIPPELQLQILESSCPSQHLTLRSVCALWKSKIDSLKFTYYTTPPLITSPYVVPSITTLTPPSESDAPFLVHKALFNCTGYFNRIRDPKTGCVILQGTKLPGRDDEIFPPGLLESTQEFIAHRNFQLIIPTKTESETRVKWKIGFGLLARYPDGTFSRRKLLFHRDDIIRKAWGMTLGDLEAFLRGGKTDKTLLQVPTGELKKFVVRVGLDLKEDKLVLLAEMDVPEMLFEQ
ncbi:hypothetical protein TWF730_003224 [Orbilia blumenaviensis]|uniref:F-box domain-containing protein n=1 Tax=Orbilia blumenaviensis TaxID=1796055 RepID=A0AAV9U7T0_9PEZI